MPQTSIIRSSTGDASTWVDVTNTLSDTNNFRSFAVFDDKLYCSASIPGLTPTTAGESVVWCSSDPGTEDWYPVSEPGFGNDDNAEIYYLEVAFGHLYASTVNYVTGFEVWKTDGTVDVDTLYDWDPVIIEGFGDTWAQYGMHMEYFGDYLYVGTAVGAGMVLKDNAPVGTRALDIIRIDEEDNAELVVGKYFPNDPLPGWPTYREPLSGWPAGFINPLNVYSWHMEVHDDILYVGTFDMTGSIIFGLADLIEMLLDELPEMSLQNYQTELESIPFDIEDLPPQYQVILPELMEILESGDMELLLDFIVAHFAGGDIWKTCDGIHWMPVTLSGFGNPRNYGIRRLLSVCDTNLFVGTGNAYTGHPAGGCEVWVGAEPLILTCDIDGNTKQKFNPDDNVYVRGNGYHPNSLISVYAFPMGTFPAPENTVAGVTAATDCFGRLPVVLLWENPLTPGTYDLWVDVNNNGVYDEEIDIWDSRCVDISMMFVVPEVPLGTLMTTMAGILALYIMGISRRKPQIIV
jgi:hypothetical protein